MTRADRSKRVDRGSADKYRQTAKVFLVSAQALDTRFPAAEKQRLLRLAKLKDTVAYQGRYFVLEEARRHLELAVRFAAWAERMYQRRRA